MKIVIMSTDTFHHRYFINNIHSVFGVYGVFYETEYIKFHYDISSPFANDEKKFEEDNFFKGVSKDTPTSLYSKRIPSVNIPEFVKEVKEIGADLGIVFGCGRIRPHLLSVFPKGIINIHRGISTLYRGLDSDLWAIYHGDFDNLGVTLHYIEEGLDTGGILSVRSICYTPADKIYHLRYKSTVMATDMMLDLLSRIKEEKKIDLMPGGKGRYYSAMPAVFKPICMKKFERYIKNRFTENAHRQ